MKLEKQKAAICGDVLVWDGRMHVIERRKDPEATRQWFLNHGYNATHYVMAKGERFTLFEKKDCASVAVSDNENFWR